MNAIAKLAGITQTIFGGMNKLGEWIAPLGLRLLRTYESGKPGGIER